MSAVIAGAGGATAAPGFAEAALAAAGSSLVAFGEVVVAGAMAAAPVLAIAAIGVVAFPSQTAGPEVDEMPKKPPVAKSGAKEAATQCCAPGDDDDDGDDDEGDGKKKKQKAKYGEESDKHVNDHGHAADGKEPTVDKTKPGETKYKSKFGEGEGGQKFTDEVMNHPDAKIHEQVDGRTRYTVDDLGRTTGTGRSLEPVRGGRVVVEGPNPRPGSKTPAGHVVTQFPF